MVYSISAILYINLSCSVLSALLFGIFAASQGSTFAPDYMKAKVSAKRIFSLEEMVPDINFYSTDGEKLVSTIPVCIGILSFSSVVFNSQLICCSLWQNIIMLLKFI